MDQRFVDAMQALKDLGEDVSVPMKGGKSYVMVKDRIEIFRQFFGAEYGINTTVDYKYGFPDGAPVVAAAFISDGSGNVVASGWAVEFVGSSDANDASPVEVAETSAIGRALACFGLHGGEYSSLNEMEAHQRKQDFRRGDDRREPYRVPDNARGNGDIRRDDRGRDDRRDGRVEWEQKSQWYVPTDPKEIWDDRVDVSGKIADQVEGIGTTHELTRYWSDLKPTIDILKEEKDGMGIIAEIKAAFATRHNMLGAKR